MRRLWLIFSQAVTVAVAVLFVVSTLKPQWLSFGTAPLPAAQAPAALPPAAAPAASGLVTGAASAPPVLAPLVSFAAAARRASPSVASVIASKARARGGNNGDPWFRFFFGEPDAGPQQGMGSAVVVSADGYLLTNNHVVEDGEDIEVVLADGRREQAKVVGTDPESDLAVLKVELGGLPAIAFGDPGAVQVGDAVLAIGNPFNVGQTVTAGIVSALGRNQLGINTFENFIQTDAAINPGNSGGALVDVDGRLLGINTAIYSRSGGSMGIGFAIPADTARLVMDGLIRDGVVTRGWIGVQTRDVTPEMAGALGLKVERGVLIAGVLENGPADGGGVKPGDVVIRVGTAEVASTQQLLNAVAALKPQSTATLSLVREGEPMEVTVQVGQRPTQQRENRPRR
jgi:Do/DeqQ family serine protease